MKRIIYKPNGKLTDFAFWATLLVIAALAYFIIGSFIAYIQSGMPLRTK